MEQTNRTILFAEINKRETNILDFIGDVQGQKSISDEVLRELHRRFAVSSYEEAVLKFHPAVYLCLDTQKEYAGMAEGQQEDVVLVPLEGHSSLTDKLASIIEAKRSGTFLTEEIAKILSESLLGDRGELFREMERELITLIAKSDMETARELIWQLFMEYDDGFFLLAYFIEEIRQLFWKPAPELFMVGTAYPSQAVAIGISGDLRRSIPFCTAEQKESYSAFVNNCIGEAREKGLIKNGRLWEGILKLPVTKEIEDDGAFFEYCLRMQELYRRAVLEFWRQAKPEIECMLGIREYFLQYQLGAPAAGTAGQGYQESLDDSCGAEEMRPVLLIANSNPDAVLQGKRGDGLRLFFETVNHKNDEQDRIWYAILPGMPEADGMTGNIRKRFEGSGTQIQYEKTSGEAVLCLLDIFSEYQIQSFVSTVYSARTSFGQLVKSGMSSFEKNFSFLEKAKGPEYVSPCFPNFCIVPEKLMHVPVGKERSVNRELWLDEVGIEASYVAAGLTAACQCPSYLSRFYPGRVDFTVPGVAYRLAADGHGRVTRSSMSREIGIVEDRIRNEAVSKSRGILFLPDGDRNVVVTDRVFSCREGNKEDCVSLVQTLTYLERKIRKETQDFKDAGVRRFFEHRPGSLWSHWLEQGEMVNAVIREGETQKYIDWLRNLTEQRLQ